MVAAFSLTPEMEAMELDVAAPAWVVPIESLYCMREARDS